MDFYVPIVAPELPIEMEHWNSFSTYEPFSIEGKLAFSNRTSKQLARLVLVSRSTKDVVSRVLFHLSTRHSLSVMDATAPAMSAD